MSDPRTEYREKLIDAMLLMSASEPGKVAGVRARLDASFLEEVNTLVQATRENVVTGLAALESEVKRARVAADLSSMAIVRWTKVLAFATLALFGATVALVWATLQLAH